MRTRRLDLRPMSPAVMRAVLAADWPTADALLGTGFPREWRADGWAWLADRVADAERDPRLLAWGTRLVSLRQATGTPAIIAEMGFHGPPDARGRVEIGYRVVAAARRRGVAEEGVNALIGWAARCGVTSVRASVGPDNVASATLLGKLGFAPAGRERHPVLGEQRIFLRAVDGVPGGGRVDP